MPSQSFRARLIAVFAGELVNKACIIAAFIRLAHTLDAGVYGEVEWALSVMMVATLASDAGLTTWAAARIAAAPDEAPRLVARVGWLRFILALPAYGVLALMALANGGRAGAALAVYGLTLFLTPLFLQYLFNGLFRTGWAALGNALRGATFLIATLLLVDPSSPPSDVARAEVLGAAALALCSAIVLWRVLRLRVPLREARAGAGEILHSSWRIGASEVTWGVHWYAGLILLGLLAGPTDAAWESASLRLVMAMHTGVWLYLYVLLPNLSKSLRIGADDWRRIVTPSLSLAAWAGGALAVVVTLAATTIMTTVFGEPFAAASPVLRTMVWVLPIAWLSGHIRYSLIAADHPQRDLQAAMVGAGVTVALTLVLLPLKSLGAALALVAGTAANAAAAWVLAGAVLPAAPWRGALLSTAFCLACLAGGLMLTPFTGEKTSAVLAGSVLGATALIAERDNVRDVWMAMIGSPKGKGASNADIRP